MASSDTERDSQPPRDSAVEFQDQLAHELIGKRVIVESADSRRFEGCLLRVAVDSHHVLLENVRELPAGTRYPIAFVAEVDWIVDSEEQTESKS